MNPGLVKTYSCGGAILARRFVKMGSADFTVVQAAASTDGIIGVSDALGGVSGKQADFAHSGILEVVYGDTVPRGSYVTTDATGRAIAVTTAMLEAAVVNISGIALVSGVVGDIGEILFFTGKQSKLDSLTASAAELNLMDGVVQGDIDALLDSVGGATIVVGEEGATTIDVTIQLKNPAAADVAAHGSVFAYLSDDAAGNSILAAASSGGIAIKTDGLLIPVVANKAFHLVSEADGDIDLTVTEAGIKTLYLVIVLPNGTLVVSDAIAFTA